MRRTRFTCIKKHAPKGACFFVVCGLWLKGTIQRRLGVRPLFDKVRPYRTCERTSRGTDLSAKWIKVPFSADVKNERVLVCTDDIVRLRPLFVKSGAKTLHKRVFLGIKQAYEPPSQLSPFLFVRAVGTSRSETYIPRPCKVLCLLSYKKVGRCMLTVVKLIPLAHAKFFAYFYFTAVGTNRSETYIPRPSKVLCLLFL